VKMGEHDVPEEKIGERYDRSLGLLFEATQLVDRAYLFDNSEKGHRLIAECESGRFVVGRPVPNWFIAAVLERLS
jgi:predicted ABC-type ATPase